MDRIRSSLQGLAFGDAVGLPRDSRPAEELREAVEKLWRGEGSPPELTRLTAVGLTLASTSAYSVVPSARFDLDAAAAAMIVWLRSGTRDVGSLTFDALGLIEAGEPLDSASISALAKISGSAGNGSLMRAAASGWARRSTDPALCLETSRLSRVTHADALCVGSCLAFAGILSALVEGSGVEVALGAGSGAISSGPYEEIEALLEAVRAGAPAKYEKAPPGFVLLCLARALVALRDARGFAEGIEVALAGGGDSDTAAAVAGALLGARFEVGSAWIRDERFLRRADVIANRLGAFRDNAPQGPRAATRAKARSVEPVRVAELSDEAVARFREDGFVLVPDMISPDRVARALERCEPLFRGEYETGIVPDDVRWVPGDRSRATREVRNAWRADRAIASIALDEKVGELAARLMGWSGTRVNQAGLLWKPPGAWAIVAHQDAGYLDWMDPHELVTCWVALEDTVEHGGAVEYAAGTHKLGLSPRRGPFDEPDDPYRECATLLGDRLAELSIVEVRVSAGGAGFHHGALWHASGHNRSEKHRRAIGIHMMPAEARFRADRFARRFTHYRRLADLEMDENYFPITWSESGYRTPAIEKFLAGGFSP
ncbi:MAG: ADP-ribosylglycohydrolase family protein [Deltaproteobacteria bacterium]|nr:ADP-ribosylglycohydrolase family protein [Deltaproteobacteria bacterium]